MKPREEAFMASQIKKSSNDLSDEVHRLPIDDPAIKIALSYLKDVKDIFQNEADKYEQFLQVMRDCSQQRVGNPDKIIAKVKELFKGYNDLIIGFNAFLPKGYEIEVTDKKKPIELKEALSYLKKIKLRFHNDERAYKSFLNILHKYRRENMPGYQVYKEVALLFHNHRDLLQEFKHFLPDTSATMSPRHSGRVLFHQKERSSETMRHVREEKRENIYIPNADRDPSVDRPDQEHDTDRQRRCGMDKKDDRDRGERQRDEKDPEHENRDLDVKHKHNITGGVDDSVTELLHQGGEGGENLAMYSMSASSFDGAYSREFKFCTKVKEKLDAGVYQEFLKCLHIYSANIIERDELKKLVNDILKKYPDLMDDFHEFLANCENMDEFLSGTLNKRNIAKPVKQVDRDRDREHERDERDRDCEREREKERKGLDEGALLVSKDVKPPLLSNKEKYNLFKPVSELDLSNCQRCTPSYCLLPENYPMPASTHRTKLEKDVLNDHWISVTSGSEDYSFKHMRKNQYEESLFRCEDDRFELDMLLESVKTTTKRVEELLEKMRDNTIRPESPTLIEDHFTSLNLRCIERLYGEHGLDVMDLLHKNLSLALPVILTRLKQKQDEWSRCRSDFNKVWAGISAKNYHKSLDHRSFYFKQQDTKSLSTKALLAEIKELNDMKPKDNDVLLTIASGKRRSIVPDMEFDYVDSDIHEDLYQIIKYSSGEVCTSSDQVDKILKIWTTFLEPMMGVPVRSRSVEYTKDLVKPKGDIVKNNGAVENLKQGNEDDINPRLANGDMTINGNGSHNVEQAGRRNWNYSITHRNENLSTGRLMDNLSLAGAKEQSQSRVNLENRSGVNIIPMKTSNACTETVAEPRCSAEVLPSSEGSDGFKPILFIKDNLKIEREEGELSPNGDSEEDNFVAFEDVDVSMEPKDVNGDDEGEGSPQRSTEYSENTSVAGEDVSGTESSDGEECSREDHEEEEDAGGDGKAESEGEAEGVVHAHDVEGEISSFPFSERFLHTVKPLAKHVPMALQDKEEKGSRIFYGNDSFYVLFRLHQTLYERILSAKTNSSATERKWRTSKDTSHSDKYAKFMNALFNLLDGTGDNTKFEDDCRAIIGTQSYLLFTLDKLIYKIVKQLQAVASDEMDNNLLQLYLYERSRRSGRFFDTVYHENACVLLHDENLYRFECSSDSSRLSIQMMEYGHEMPKVAAALMNPNFAAHLHNEFLSSSPERKDAHGVFLMRYKRKYGSEDEYSSSCNDMEDVKILNGLECRISCISSKVSYVLDTEDYLIRTKKRRRSYDHHTQEHLIKVEAEKVQRFHRFLSID